MWQKYLYPRTENLAVEHIPFSDYPSFLLMKCYLCMDQLHKAGPFLLGSPAFYEALLSLTANFCIELNT